MSQLHCPKSILKIQCKKLLLQVVTNVCLCFLLTRLFVFQLDGDQADVDDEEPDFYAEAPLPG